MSTRAQTRYILDLAVVKTKEYKEVKELLYSNDIVSQDSVIVEQAASLSDVVNALTDAQASRLIDVLVDMKVPSRSRVYSDNRVRKAIRLLDEIKQEINDWTF